MVTSGVSGAILSFRHEIDALLNPRLLTVSPRPEGEAAFTPMAEIFASALRGLPEGTRLGFSYYPHTDASAYLINLAVPAGGGEQGGALRFDSFEVFVDPYTAAVTGRRLVRAADDLVPRTFIAFFDGLHLSLLLPGNGGPIVGWGAVLLCVSLLTGLVLWWPTDGRWSRVLTVKRMTTARFNYDLHQATGFYFLVVLFVVLMSGTALFNLRAQFHSVVRLFSPTVDRYSVRSHTGEGRTAISTADAVAFATAYSSEGRLDWLYQAPGPTSAYTICRRLSGDGWFAGRRCVAVDKYSGEILNVAGPVEGTRGDRFVYLQWFLHSGQLFGMTGRIVVMLSGLAGPLLVVTGVTRWLQKRGARTRAARVRGAMLARG